MNKNKIIKKVVLVGTILATTMCSGCLGLSEEGVESYELVSPMSNQEISDYYVKAMSYDAVVSKNVTVHETQYVLHDIDESKVEKLKKLVANAQQILNQKKYVIDENTSKLITEDEFYYMKSIIDNYVLNEGTITNMKSALGYYFVDVDYTVQPSAVGSFKPVAQLSGLDGVWITNFDGQSTVNKSYLMSAAETMNKYYIKNGISLKASYDENEMSFKIDEANNSSEAPLSSATEETIRLTSDEGVKDNSTSVVDGNRKLSIDVNSISEIAGWSLEQRAHIPNLESVYNIAENEGQISGYAIYPQGIGGGKIFGYNRDSLNGKITVRYVFKDSDDATGKIEGSNVYVTNIETENGVSVSEQNVVIPEVANTEIEKIIDRADRAYVNADLSGLINGDIYEDIGYGILRGYADNHMRIQNAISKVKQIIARDIEHNAYLVEVETNVTEGTRGNGSVASYLDTKYVVIQQQGTEFKITDSILKSREMIKEPQLNPKSASFKKLVALNLAGEVKEENKVEIDKLLKSLYESLNDRQLSGPYEVEGVKKEKGVQDCFNNDTGVINSDTFDYIISQVTSNMIKYGAENESVIKGEVTSWLSGYENQAEFTTEELVTYSGINTGVYEQVYYLVSNMEGQWVIDERKVLESKEVEEAEIGNIQSRLQ